MENTLICQHGFSTNTERDFPSVKCLPLPTLCVFSLSNPDFPSQSNYVNVNCTFSLKKMSHSLKCDFAFRGSIMAEFLHLPPLLMSPNPRFFFSLCAVFEPIHPIIPNSFTHSFTVSTHAPHFLYVQSR